MLTEQDLLTRFGAKIKSARISSGLRQIHLAQMVGTKQGSISEIEQGKSNVSIALALKLMEALGLDIIDTSDPNSHLELGQSAGADLNYDPYADLAIIDVDDIPELQPTTALPRMR